MKFNLFFLLVTLLTPIAHAADFELKGYGAHVNGPGPNAYIVDTLAPETNDLMNASIAKITTVVEYRYTLVNNTPSNVANPQTAYRFEVGLSAPQSLSSKPELTGLPSVPSPRSGLPMYPGNGVLSMTAPTGWNGHEGGEQEHVNHTLIWALNLDANRSYIKAAALLPGQTLAGFSVTRLGRNDGYLNVGFIVSGLPNDFAGRVTRQDTLPPVLSVTLTPSTLKSNEKLVSIAATITVTDDYDPLPAIVLESITANEKMDGDDIKDAKFGTDDRAFKLKAEREGKNKAGRIYTVTYSATDGSGNKTTASATVTVPHDERKKDD